MIAYITETFAAHPYLIVFIGMLFAGESVLLPAMHYALLGKLEPAFVIAVALASMMLSDVVWYYIGGHIKQRYMKRMVSGKAKASIERLSGVFSRRGPLVLYLSKFVYGTRIAAQILAGAEGMKFRTYIGINFLGVSTLIAALYILSYFIQASVSGLQGVVHIAEISFLALVVVIVGLHIGIGSYIKKKWFQ
jgi:membrane protein DedA with SNARE-associated domain